MNPKSNLALVPPTSVSDTLHLHAQELRHLGLLRRFKRACDEREHLLGLQHETDQLRLDLRYRQNVLQALERCNDAALRAWHPLVVDALAALDVIQQHLKDSDAGYTAAPEPQAAPVAQVPVKKAVPAKKLAWWPLPVKHLAIAIPLVLMVVAGLVFGLSYSVRQFFGPSTPAVIEAQTVFRIHGSNTIGEALAPALVGAFVRDKQWQFAETRSQKPLEKLLTFTTAPQAPLQGIELHAHGSGTAFTSLKESKADIGMSSRPIKDAENTELSPVYGDMRALGAEHVIALDGLAVIVNPTNAIKQLTVEQIAAIFAGRVTNWQELGGANQPIVLHARDEKSGTWDSFKAMVLDRQKVKLDTSARRYESSQELSDTVAATPGAIGFIGLPFVRQARAIAVADTPQSVAFLPTFFTVSTEDYPLSRRLFMYAPADRLNQQAKQFVEFAQSDAGQEIVRQSGFVPQMVTAETVSPPMNAPAIYGQLAGAAQRLSITFRFRNGSDELDSKASRDMGRLLDYLTRHPGKPVYLLGFSDAVGAANKNNALSQSRADTVARLLTSAGITPAEVFALGGSLPVASNNDDWGRNRNRRVEIWVGR